MINSPQQAGSTVFNHANNLPRLIQRKCKCGNKASECNCTNCQKKTALINRKSLVRKAHNSLRPSLDLVERVIASPGRPLETSSRQFFESRFDKDFSQVRVHTGPDAAESASSIDAHAYTVGDHIVFGHSAFQPESVSGKKLLAHELTHVVQQGNSETTRGNLVLDSTRSSAEKEAAQIESDILIPSEGSKVIGSQLRLAEHPTKTTSHTVFRKPKIPGEGLKSPGDCTIGRHAQLQARKNLVCNEGPKCTSLSDPVQIDLRIARLMECYSARVRLMSECFRGGDANHRRVAKEWVEEAVQNCLDHRDKILKERKEKPNPILMPNQLERVGILLTYGVGVAIAMAIVFYASTAAAVVALIAGLMGLLFKNKSDTGQVA